MAPMTLHTSATHFLKELDAQMMAAEARTGEARRPRPSLDHIVVEKAMVSLTALTGAALAAQLTPSQRALFLERVPEELARIAAASLGPDTVAIRARCTARVEAAAAVLRGAV